MTSFSKTRPILVLCAAIMATTAIPTFLQRAASAQATGRTLYVSQSGNNTTGLSLATAFRTLQQAADTTVPGDTVLVKADQLYETTTWYDANLIISRSGQPNAPITFKAYPGDRPHLKAAGYAGISVNGASYIRIEGFEVEGNSALLNDATAQAVACRGTNDSLETGAAQGNGISVGPALDSTGTPTSRPHHVVVHDNRVHSFGGSGIEMLGMDYVTVENNVVYNNAKWSPYGNSGITLGYLWNSDALPSVPGGLPYKNVVRNNQSYGNENRVGTVVGPVIGPSGTCASSPQITDGNGIILDDLRNTQSISYKSPKPYAGRTLVENNVVSSNGGRGINVYSSDHADVVNNTSVLNGRSDPAVNPRSAITSETSVGDASDVRFLNNIIVARPTQKASLIFQATSSDLSTLRYDNNLVFGGTSFDTGPGANNVVGRDPLFVNQVAGDFTLQTGSPAIDAAVAAFGNATAPTLDQAYNPRPQGNGYDIGAYERAGAVTPTTVPATTQPTTTVTVPTSQPTTVPATTQPPTTVPVTSSPPTTVATGLTDGIYAFTPLHIDKQLAIVKGATTEGSRIEQRVWADADDQKWKVERLSDGTYRFTSQKSRLVLGVRKARVNKGATVRQYAWDGSCGQKWRLQARSDGGFTIRSSCNSLVFDIRNGSTSNGALLQLWTSGGESSKSQGFLFERV
jgi:Right handed beta helix region/Ricin-type beta-trefoil lectin domain-like